MHLYGESVLYLWWIVFVYLWQVSKVAISIDNPIWSARLDLMLADCDWDLGMVNKDTENLGRGQCQIWRTCTVNCDYAEYSPKQIYLKNIRYF